MSSYFSDPDNDHLTYSATSSDPAVAISEGAINGRVNIRALELGTAMVTITARDPGGLEATQTISVTVKYPKPTTGDSRKHFHPDDRGQPDHRSGCLSILPRSRR